MTGCGVHAVQPAARGGHPEHALRIAVEIVNFIVGEAVGGVFVDGDLPGAPVDFVQAAAEGADPENPVFVGQRGVDAVGGERIGVAGNTAVEAKPLQGGGELIHAAIPAGKPDHP